MIPLLIAGGLAAAGAIANAVGSSNAARAQKSAAQQALDLQKRMYEQGRADQMPFLQGGQQTFAKLLEQMGAGAFNPDPSQIANDPGFQFRMAQGQKALERSAAARGGLMSGGFSKSLDRYSQGLASDEYQNAFNRGQARFGNMLSVAQMGQNAAGAMNGIGANYAQGGGQALGAIGNANSAGALAVPNAVSGFTNQMGSMMGMAAGGMGGGGGSTGYAAGYMPQGGLGLNYGGGQSIPTQLGGRGFGLNYGGY